MKSVFSIISVLSLLSALSATAQFSPLWSADFQGTSLTGFSTEAKNMVKDDAGNIYVVTDLTSNMDPTGLATASTFHYTTLLKYSPTGLLVNTRNILVNDHQVTGQNLVGAFGLEIDANNYLYVGYVNYNTITNYNVNIAKYDTSLIRYWNYNFNPTGVEQGVELKISANGHIYGLVRSTTGSNVQYQIIKADSGVVSATPFYAFDTNIDFVNSMYVESNGDIFITGYRFMSGVKNALTAGIKNAGTLRWKKTYNGGTVIRDDSGNRIIPGTSSELFIVGSSDRGTPNFNDIMVLKYIKTNGRLEWVTFLDNNAGFDEGVLIKRFNLYTLYTASKSGNQVLLDRIDTRTGTHTGRHRYEPEPQSAFSSINSVSISDLEISPVGNAYLSGNVYATNASAQNFSAMYCIKLKPLSGRTLIDDAFKLEDGIPVEGDFNLSYNSIGIIPDYSTNELLMLTDQFGDFNSHSFESVKLFAFSITAPMKISSTLNLPEFGNNDINIFPNPASGVLYVQTEQSITGISIYDVTGKIIYTIDQFYTNKVYSLDISGLNKGMYLLKIESDQSAPSTSRFIKN